VATHRPSIRDGDFSCAIEERQYGAPSFNIVRAVKSGMMRCAGHVERRVKRIVLIENARKQPNTGETKTKFYR
jgi:hypothetical protein